MTGLRVLYRVARLFKFAKMITLKTFLFNKIKIKYSPKILENLKLNEMLPYK